MPNEGRLFNAFIEVGNKGSLRLKQLLAVRY